MQYSKLIVIAAGFAALAACGDNTVEDDTLNADLNTMATDNLMPPAEDVTIDANNVTIVDNNMTDANLTTTTDNTTNAY